MNKPEKDGTEDILFQGKPPTFINEAGRFYLVHEQEYLKKKIQIYAAILFDGHRSYVLSDGERFIYDSPRLEDVGCFADVYLYEQNFPDKGKRRKFARKEMIGRK